MSKVCWTHWRKEKRNKQGHSANESGRKRFWLKQSQSKWLAFIVIWCEECGRKKIGKGERNKRERLFGHLKKSKKREVPQVRLRTKVQSGRTAWVRASQREEKNREGKRKYTVRKRVVSEKKKIDFFIQVVSLRVVISIWYSEIIRSLSRDFSFKEKGFVCKSLCFCVVVIPLCLLKFIHSYIEFFPTQCHFQII